MLFSVIIPAYNAEKFILRSITSVIHQSCQMFEIIVVDDGSRDHTLDVLKQIDNENIKVISQNNKGVSVARNVGIENATGEFICFLDADDEFLPNHLQVLSEMISQNSDKSFFATRFCITKRDNSNVLEKTETMNTTVYYKNFVAEIIKEPEKIHTGCVCIRRSMFEKYGMFESGVKLGEDTDMWRRIYVHTGVVFGDYVTLKVNRDGSEATKTYTRRFEVDPLDRMTLFMSDAAIDQEIKASLIIENEYTKVQVVRSNLLIGNKWKAWMGFKEINRKYIPIKRLLITAICFCVPSKLLMHIMKKKNSGIYE